MKRRAVLNGVTMSEEEIDVQPLVSIGVDEFDPAPRFGKTASGAFDSTYGDGKCDLLRFVNRNDPFYANDTDVIATCDIDYEEVKRLLTAHEKLVIWDWKSILGVSVILGAIFLLVVLSLVFVSSFDTYSKDIGVFYSLCVAIICLGGTILFGALFSLTWYAGRYKELVVACRRHVAITRESLYVDESEEFKCLQLARRQTFQFHEILHCSVFDDGCWRPSYCVALSAIGENQMGSKVLVKHHLRGIRDGQRFIDVLMERVRAAKAIENLDPTVIDAAESEVVVAAVMI